MSKASMITCWMNKDELERMAAAATVSHPKETGGLLVGYWSSANEVVISVTTLAGPNAKHTKTTFEPDYSFDKIIMARLYNESAGTLTYLGDWHSHPNGTCALSYTDRRALASIARSPEARAALPLMAIISGGAKLWELGMWYKAQRCWRLFAEYPKIKIEIY